VRIIPRPHLANILSELVQGTPGSQRDECAVSIFVDQLRERLQQRQHTSFDAALSAMAAGMDTALQVASGHEYVEASDVYCRCDYTVLAYRWRSRTVASVLVLNECGHPESAHDVAGNDDGHWYLPFGSGGLPLHFRCDETYKEAVIAFLQLVPPALKNKNLDIAAVLNAHSVPEPLWPLALLHCALDCNDPFQLWWSVEDGQWPNQWVVSHCDNP
jgi:hypothetical protein